MVRIGRGHDGEFGDPSGLFIVICRPRIDDFIVDISFDIDLDITTMGVLFFGDFDLNVGTLRILRRGDSFLIIVVEIAIDIGWERCVEGLVADIESLDSGLIDSEGVGRGAAEDKGATFEIEHLATAVGDTRDESIERLVVLDEIGLSVFEIPRFTVVLVTAGAEGMFEFGGRERDPIGRSEREGIVGRDVRRLFLICNNLGAGLFGDDVGSETLADIGAREGVDGEEFVAAENLEFNVALGNILVVFKGDKRTDTIDEIVGADRNGERGAILFFHIFENFDRVRNPITRKKRELLDGRATIFTKSDRDDSSNKTVVIDFFEEDEAFQLKPDNKAFSYGTHNATRRSRDIIE